MTAMVKEIDGELVLIDPVAESVIAAVEAFNKKIGLENCRELLKLNLDRIKYFQRSADPRTMVVVVLDVDDPLGAAITEALMPGANWQEYRDRGEKPIARGIALKDGLISLVEEIRPNLKDDLAQDKEVCVLVVTSGTMMVSRIEKGVE